MRAVIVLAWMLAPRAAQAADAAEQPRPADAGPARAAEPGVAAGLARNAWYWQARARSDKAEDAWKQVLEAAPDNAEALAATGLFDARAGRTQQAREKLARLEKSSPGHPDVPVLRRALELGPRAGALLSQARKLVHEGRVPEGASAYRELFGPAGPPGDLALEYYQTLSGAPGGFEQAREGLRRLVRRAPAEARYRLSLAKLLTYRDETRREGVRLLSSLARDPTVGKEATASWRQALLWLVPSAQDAPLFLAWAREHPGDSEVSARAESGRKGSAIKDAYAALERGNLEEAERRFRALGSDPEARRGLAIVGGRRTGQAKKAGFAALHRGDLAAAEELFRAAGDDPDTRLGRALVAQREAAGAQRAEDLPRARALLELAKALAPQQREIWEEPLRSVSFWSLLREAKDAQALGRGVDAEAALRAALALAPERDRWHAELALGDLYLAQRAPAKAEPRYRGVLAALPDQPQALRALVGLLVQSGRYEEALPVNDHLVRVAPKEAARPEWLRAEILRAGAGRSRSSRDLPRARAQLEAALKLDPANVWVLHDLANVLLETGAAAEARPVVAALLRVAPSLPEGQVVLARLLVAQRDNAGALAVLQRLSPPPRDPAVTALRRNLEVVVQIPAILKSADKGDRRSAMMALVELQQSVENEPDLAAEVAVAWSRLGERERALSLMRTAMAKAPEATRGARLELASTLLDAGDDAAVGQLLAGLERDPSLSEAERGSLGGLRIAHAVRLADRDREAGDPAAASAVLDPVLRDYPRDPRLVAALARALEHQDEARAHALYLTVLAATPGDLDAARGAVDTALALGNLDEAKALSAEATRLHPKDARAYLIAADVAARANDDSAAMKALVQARTLVAPQRAELRPEDAAGSSAESVEPDQERPGAGSDALGAQVEEQILGIHNRHRPGFEGGFTARQRQGEAGLSKLLELRQPAELKLPIGFSGHASLQATAVELDSGSVGGSAAPRFGTGGPANGRAQSATGTELRAAWESEHFDAFVGTTPIGFPVLSPLGGVRLRGGFGPLSVALEGSRRSVTDSLLSYAGAHDPATGKTWGGVVMDGGRLDLRLSLGAVHYFVYGELHRVIGYEVARNLRAAGGAGAEAILYDGFLGQIGLGPSVAALGYDRNLRFFTFGQGGYFSPQRFLHGGLALNLRRTGSVHWSASVEPGYDAFTESASAAFPLAAPGSQEAAAAPYPGKRSAGFSLNSHAELGFQLSKDVEAGFTFGILRAPQFQELSGGLMLRFGGAGKN